MARSFIDRLPIGWAGKLAFQRLTANWRSLLTVIAGTLLGACVGALIPLYTSAVSQVSMVEKLAQQDATNVHWHSVISLTPSKTSTGIETIPQDEQFRAIVERHIGLGIFPGWVNTVNRYRITVPLDILPPAEDAEAEVTARASLADYADWQSRIALVAGRLPVDVNGDQIEAVVPFEASSARGINIDDVLILDQGGAGGGWETSRNITVRVVGIVDLPASLTPLEQGYFIAPSPLDYGAGSDVEAEFTMLTTPAALTQVATQYVPDTPLKIGWRVIFDHARLPFARSPEARTALNDMRTALLDQFDPQPLPSPRLGYSATTKLIDYRLQNGNYIDNGVILDYERSVRSLDAPFGLLLLQVGALVIFFILVTAALVRRGERREIAMLQSRGAMDRHILVIRGVEALLICAATAAIAPLISQQLLILITPFFARYNNLPLPLTPSAFVYAAVAAVIAFLALMFTLRPVLRLPLISAGGSASRSDRQPFWQKYYLDVLLVVLGIAALWRLVGRDNPIITSQAGSRATDPFLLLAPALLFLGLGSVLLRLFPVIAGFASRLLSIGRGLVAPMATWQIAREPVHYGRITFLLALAIGIGYFATSFRATVDRSQSDQAQYRIGTDVRFVERDLRLNVNRSRPLAAYTALPDVEAATLAWRQFGLDVKNTSGDSLPTEILAIDPDTFGQASYWRPDLGSVGLPRPQGQHIDLPIPGVELEQTPAKLNLWARFTLRGAFGEFVASVERLRNRTQIFIRLLDEQGAWVIVPLQIVELEYEYTPQRPELFGSGNVFNPNGWIYYQADLSALKYQPVGKVRVTSVFWSHRGQFQNGERDLRLTLAGLTATTPDNTATPLDLFTLGGWEFAYDGGAEAIGSISRGYVDERRGDGITMQWDQQAAFTRVGMLLNYPSRGDLPVVISSSLAANAGLNTGAIFEVRQVQGVNLKLRVVAVQQYYPTLYDSYRQDNANVINSRVHPFVIADRDLLLYTLNRRPGATLYPSEVWIRTQGGLSADGVQSLLSAATPADGSIALTRPASIPTEIASLRSDPLSLGLLGLMILAFIIAMALSVVGLLTYAALTAAARRSEFGIMQALGLSSGRLVLQLAFEQIFVVGLGVVLGGLLGAILSSQVVPRLALDSSSQNITPPFIVQVEASALVQYGLLLVVVLALALAFSMWIVRRMSVTRTLRLGEE